MGAMTEQWTDAVESGESDEDCVEICGGPLSSISDKQSPGQLTFSTSGSDTSITIIT